MKKIVCIITIFALVLLSGCGSDSEDLTNQAKSIAQADNEYVLSVKGGSPKAYPDITYEEAFESFFGSPTWTYFQGTREEDDTQYDVVEFTGDCVYADVEVKALIQFTIDEEQGTFEATYLSFNDVPQTDVVLGALLEKVFTEYQDAQ